MGKKGPTSPVIQGIVLFWSCQPCGSVLLEPMRAGSDLLSGGQLDAVM